MKNLLNLTIRTIIGLGGDFMSEINIKEVIETIKDLPEDTQETILYLTQIFKGEEETINEYIQNELNK